MHIFKTFIRRLSSISYHKINRQDAELSKLFLNISKINIKSNEQRIIIEGYRMINDAVISNLSPDYILFSKSEHLKLIESTIPLEKLKDTTIIKVPYNDLKLWSQMTTFSGMMGIFKKPNVENLFEQNYKNALPINVICDNIREPNNLGSIIRTCAAIPIRKVIVTKGCAYPWEAKCLRGGAGGHFRVPVFGPLLWDEILTDHLDKNGEMYVADNSNLGIPFNEIHYKSNDIEKTIIIGGETHGISEEARNLCNKMKGSLVHIPMANKMDSLNTASAISVILFDMRHKFLKFESDKS